MMHRDFVYMLLLMWNIWKTINYHSNQHIESTVAKTNTIFSRSSHICERLLRVSKITMTTECFNVKNVRESYRFLLIMSRNWCSLTFHFVLHWLTVVIITILCSIGIHFGLIPLNHISCNVQLNDLWSL